jgi:hypothetical protein
MEPMNLEMIKSGLMAGAAVAAVSGLAVMALSTVVGDLRTDALVFAGKWAGIALAFGVVAAFAYSFVRTQWAWGGEEYLLLAVALAAVLTAMEFLPIYGPQALAPHWQAYAVLNFAFALGFGHLVPRLMGP